MGGVRPALDHVRLAAALSRAAGSHFVHTALPFESVTFVDDEKAVRFDAAGEQGTGDPTTYECVPSQPEAAPKDEARSPDGKWTAFVRNDNLFVREIATGAERQITTD